jgi:hypothetical protein
MVKAAWDFVVAQVPAEWLKMTTDEKTAMSQVLGRR